MMSESVISAFYPFNKLNKAQLREVIKEAEEREYKKDEIVYSEGDEPDYFYFLIQGRAVAISIVKSKQKVIDLIKKGTSFGIISIFTGYPHSVTVKVIERSKIITIKKSKFKQLLKTISSLALDLSIILSRRVRKRSDSPKMIFESVNTTVLVLGSYEGAFKTIMHIAHFLRYEASRKVAVIELSGKDGFLLTEYADGCPLRLELSKGFKESMIMVKHKAKTIDYVCLYCQEHFKDDFYSFSNYLSENYHFVFYIMRIREFHNWHKFIIPNSNIYIMGTLGANNLDFVRSIKKDIQSTSSGHGVVKTVMFLKKSNQSIPGFIKEEKDTYTLFNEEKDYFVKVRRIYRDLADRKLGIALGSGGAYGASHIGTFKLFKKYKIDLDMICGSSIGAVIAALWALGYSSGDMEKALHSLGKSISLLSFSGISFPFKGILSSKKLKSVFKGIFGNKRFSDTKIPLLVVTFDFKNRRQAVIKEGLIYNAVSASCAIPGIFEPVHLKGNIFLDGGVLDPLPVKVLLDYGIKKIIAVNVTPYKDEMRNTYELRKVPFNVFDFIFGSIETMQEKFVEDALEAADIVIHPNLGDLRWTDFYNSKEFVKRGYQAASQKIEGITRLIKY